MNLLTAMSICLFPFSTVAVGPNLTKFDHFTKHISNAAISVGGRLQEREIGYIAAAGFMSILSVVDFPTSDSSFKNMSGTWPSSEEEKLLSESYGLNMTYFASSLTVESVDKASAIITQMAKPIYVQCHVIKNTVLT